ncbi:DUF4189 domain-containing protein [Lentilitoribacter sp. EG35]|uniref:DUF4189 domain-containing protein n=1 Tax=Lentilitoribacter sp. EG35 TaxID=3234192 RepID=UPI00345F5B16
MKTKYKMLVISTLMTATLTNISHAGSSGYERCWGAVAIGPNGHAWSHSYSSENGAINSVRNNCNGPCSTIKTFYNTCGSIASAPNGAWGWAWNGNMEAAKSEAMSYCMDNGQNCTPRVWACSN